MFGCKSCGGSIATNTNNPTGRSSNRTNAMALSGLVIPDAPSIPVSPNLEVGKPINANQKTIER